MKISMLSRLLASCVLAAVLFQSVARADEFDRQVKLDIAPQPLASALLTFAEQSNIQVVTSSSDLQQYKTQGLNGTFSVRAGISALLNGTGLVFRQVGSGTISIGPAPAKSAAKAAADTAIHLAQAADASAARAEDANEGNKASVEAADPQDARGIPEILVKGSRALNTDIRRTEDDTQPYIVFEAAEIAGSQATTVEQFLRQRLPMNTQAEAPSQRVDTLANSTSAINLRGLGTEQTLILVDGRRAPRVYRNGFDVAQADINGIPISSIERIEILPSTAGGVYGGGAVGGVINIVRKRDYSGLDVGVACTAPFDTNAGSTSTFDLSGGTSFLNNQLQLNFGLSQSQTRRYQVGDSRAALQGRDLYIRNYSANYPESPIAGYTPNIQSEAVFDLAHYLATGEVRYDIPELVLDDGRVLGSSFTHIPDGYRGITQDGVDALLANAGSYNTATPNDFNGLHANTLNAPIVRSANLGFRFEPSAKVAYFLDLTASENVGESNYLDTFLVPNSVTIAADAPNNPFQQNITVAFPVIGLERPLETHSEVYAGTLGVIWRLNSGWTVNAEYAHAMSRSSIRYTRSPIDGSVYGLFANGSLDLLRDINLYPVDYGLYLVNNAQIHGGPFDNVQNQFSIRTTGSLFDLRGGEATMTAAIERRDEVSEANRIVTSTLITLNPERTQTVDSIYAEVALPIVSPHNHIPLAREIALQLAVRGDRYVTRVTDPQSGYVSNAADPAPNFDYNETKVEDTGVTVSTLWSPAEGLRLRASFATGFLPPSISQLVSSTLPFTFPIALDPQRPGMFVGGEGVSYNYVSAGNPDLKPEQSESYSYGAVLEPRRIKGLRLSVDYTHIAKTDEIRPLDIQALLANEDAYPGRVERGPNLPGDPPGWRGPVTFIDVSLINLAKTTAEALDIQADYSASTGLGSLRMYLVATRQLSLSRRFDSHSQAYDAVGFSDGPLEWRGNGGVEWSFGDLAVNWNAQYYDGYDLNFADPASGSNNFQVALQGTSKIPSQIYHDVVVRYTLPRNLDFVRDAELVFGVQNVFDKDPPAIAALVNGYSRYGDPRGRRFSLSVRKHFGSK